MKLKYLITFTIQGGYFAKFCSWMCIQDFEILTFAIPNFVPIYQFCKKKKKKKNNWNMEPPQRKPLSHRNFLIIFTPYVCTLITTIFQEKK